MGYVREIQMAATPSRFVGILAVLACAGAASAQIPWGGGMASGNGSFFSWANGQNQTNLFGTPTLVGDTFFFTPIAFVANATNGATVAVTDTFEVDLFVNAGFKFDAIQISEFGDYAITNTGTPVGLSSVDADGLLRVDEIGGLGRSDQQSLAFPALPVSSAAATSGLWQGDGMSNLTLLEGSTPFTQIHLKVTNDLIAISGGQGQVAEIRKTVFGGMMAVTIVPTPGTLGLLGAAGFLAARRRRA
jgi:hypothetical protein